MVLEAIRRRQLYAKFGKCEFWLEEVKFLDHVINREGVAADSSKTQAVVQWERPKTVVYVDP